MNGARASWLGRALVVSVAWSLSPAEGLVEVLPADLVGCEAVLEDGTCETADPPEVRVFVAGGGAEVLVDGQPAVAATRAPVEGGERWVVPLPPRSRSLEIVRREAAGAREAVRRVPLADGARARRLKAELGALPNAELEAREGEATLEGALALGLLARRRLGGDATARARASADLERASERLRALGRASDALRDDLARAYAAIFLARDLLAARALLDGPLGALEATEWRAQRLFTRLLFEVEAGDVRRALAIEREIALDRARAFDGDDARCDGYRADVGRLQIRAQLLFALGRDDEADATVAELDRRLASPSSCPEAKRACTEAEARTTHGWAALWGLEPHKDEDGRSAARPALERARTLYEGPCASELGLANARTNLALLDLEEGRVADARRELERARATTAAPGPRVLAYWRYLEARLSLDAGHPEAALGDLDALADLAASAGMPEAATHAAIGRGRALAAAGRDDEARAAYAEAIARLDDRSLLVPLGHGREAFLGGAEGAAAELVGLLLRADPAAAARIARRSRARTLASLHRAECVADLPPDARAAWDAAMSRYRAAQAELASEERLDAARAASLEAAMTEALDAALAGLPGDCGDAATEPAPPAPGEVILVYHPTPRGLAGLAITAERAVGRELSKVRRGDDPARLAEALLAPFDDVLEGASRVRLLPSGALAALDLHALPFRGAPLLAHAEVTYGVDRGEASSLGGPPLIPPTPAADLPRPPRALLLVDPRGNLASAAQEGDRVRAALVAAGWEVDELRHEAATREAVLGRLASGRFELLHYAGHAAFLGASGWQSRLLLAWGGSVGVVDLLGLPRAPRLVVLSACESAATDPRDQPLGMNLANAFLAAGSELVIASERAVDDRVAEAIMARLYAREALDPASVGAAALVRALGRAELATRAEATSDWAVFRALVP